MATNRWVGTGYSGLVTKKGRFNGYSMSGEKRRFAGRPGLGGQLDRMAMKLSGQLEDLKALANYEWDEIMRSTAKQAPVPPRNTYGVDTRGGRYMVKFKIWWEDFKGRPAAAQERFEPRRASFQDWFGDRVRDMKHPVRKM